ncbi:MAG: VCBS repeat-containing protein [Deltaproteobacteria bacterium]|nr:VCBS repeat-containing protein [Deltaproteobacteria bacterium]
MRMLRWAALSVALLPLSFARPALADGNLPDTPVVKLRIPIRMVQALSCDPALPSCNQQTIFAESQIALDRANFHWQYAGVEFWIKSYEYVHAPHLYRREADDEAEIAFSEVKEELHRMFPSMPLNAYSDGETKRLTIWVRAVAAFYQDPNELFVWLVNGQSEGTWPHQGRIIHLNWSDGNVNQTLGIPSTAFGHELGHYFGLQHNDDDSLLLRPNASGNYTKCDRWDAYFKNTSPPQFFTGPTSPGCNDNDAVLIAPVMDLRANAPDALPSFRIGPTSFTIGSWQIKGLAAWNGNIHLPPTWGWAQNMMGKLDPSIEIGIPNFKDNIPDVFTGIDGRTPRFISESQLRIIEDYLSSDMNYTTGNADAYKNGSSNPVGGLSNGLSNLRTKLGKSEDDFIWWSNAERYEDFSFTSIAKEVAEDDLAPVAGDFNCDGMDDLAWYRPTAGTLTLWTAVVDTDLHRPKFSVGSPTTIGADRIVFGGDFDGNSCGDLFFYRPGTLSDLILFGNSTGIWFQSAQTVNDNTYQPFSADLEGDGDDDIIWYRAGSVADIWRGNGSTQSPSSAGTTFTKTTGTYVGPGNFYTPIVGNFDGAAGEEVLWYAGGPGADVLWKSQGAATVQQALDIDGYYRPVAGDFNGDGRDDIIWDDMLQLRAPIWEGVSDFSDMFATGSQAMLRADHRGIAGDFDGDGATDIFYYRDAIQKWVDAFNYDGGWRVDRHPRLLGDLNNDGKLDIVGFGNSGTEVSLSTGFGFKPASRWVENFNYNNGWRIENHLRFLADVDADGDDDVIGIGNSGVMVAKSTGTGLGAVNRWIEEFHFNDNWLVDRHPRMMADVNNDGRADVIGFGNNGVTVATANTAGTAFNSATSWSSAFGYNDGWRTERHVRVMADASGEGRDDIIAFGDDGVTVSYSTGATFQAPSLKVSQFGYNQGWRIDRHPRLMADVNGDGRADIVGFANDGVLVSLANNTFGFNAPVMWSDDFGYNDSWRVETHPRLVEDVNGDGKADVIAFGNRTVYVAFSSGQGFSSPVEWIDAYTPEHGGWAVDRHPRVVGDVTGDGRADIVGFGDSTGTYVTPSRLSYSAQ